MTSNVFVALDVETTGLDPTSDRITEIGAVRFGADGEPLGTFETLINPGREIPLFVQQLTGITDADVRDAPLIDDVAVQLREFVGGSPIVGQNVGFDMRCLQREGVSLPNPAIDTAELSRYVLPERQNRGLMELAVALGVEAGAHHRALPDARTAAAIFAALLQRLDRLPAPSRDQLATLVAFTDPVAAGVIGGPGWVDGPTREKALPAFRPAPEYTALVRRDPRQPVLAAEVARAFEAGRANMERFEERPQQRRMAEAVLSAMSEGGHWLIEAGTGVGKSLAYLIPAALHAIRNGERVVISTNTINLQEQLFQKDIPTLRRLLVASGAIKDERDLRASLLKGRANYLCTRRWMASYAANMGDPDFSRLAASMLLWLPETETGDRSELNLDHDEWLTWQRFSAQDVDCLSRQNNFVREGHCFLQRARRAAETSHLLIVNHALLLADIASAGNAIPAYDHLVIDEAHNLEDQATNQFGGTVSRRILADSLDGLHRHGGRDHREGGAAALLKALPEGALLQAALKIEQAVERALTTLGPLFENLAGHVPGGSEDERVLVTKAMRARDTWTAVELAWATTDRALRECVSDANAAARLLADSGLVEQAEALAGEVETTSRKVDDLRMLLEELMGTTGDETIVWLGRERDGTASLNSAPLDVGPTLWEELFAKRRTVVATSATLSAAGDMAYSARRLGLEYPETLSLGSPFDYKASTLLTAFTDIPEPNDGRYGESVAAAVRDLALASDGRALALFTSHNALRAVANSIRADMAAEGIAVLAQGIDGSPRQLADNLRTSPRSLVLGTSSFWEGVDIRGDALSLLIIARLPFAVPTDPVHRARSEQYDNPFGQYSLPTAILKFRQGFGRLIRDRDDRGVVAVLDRRIWEKGYGRDFVSALPDCSKFRGDTAAVAARVRDWLAR